MGGVVNSLHLGAVPSKDLIGAATFVAPMLQVGDREQRPSHIKHKTTSAEAENELKPEMPKDATGDRHVEVGRVREIHCRFAPGHVLLLEENFFLRPVQRAPISNATLEPA